MKSIIRTVLLFLLIIDAVPAEAQKSEDSSEKTAAMSCKEGNFKDCSSKCADGDLGSCNALGIMYSNGAGVEKDLSRAVETWRKACEKDNCDFR